MKKIKIICALYIILNVFSSCKNEDKVAEAIETTPVSFSITRFEQEFYNTKPEQLLTLKSKYPFMFPKNVADSVWVSMLTDTLSHQLFVEVQKKYKDIKWLEQDIEDFLKHVKYYYPKITTPKVFTVITEVDRESKVLYANDYLFISLDCYLGENHEFYSGFPKYIRANMQPAQIICDVANSFAETKIPFSNDRTLISKMVQEGKKLYVKDILLPKKDDYMKIGYSPEKLQWCIENEPYMWSYFIENKLLYDTNTKNELRFINDAPFSKFYLEIDNESPGRVGAWLGWQIVRSYMENNDVSWQQMLAINNKEIFEKSKYKPKNPVQ